MNLPLVNFSVLEWYEQDGNVVVRRAGRFTSSDIHQALFAKQVRKEVPDVKDAIRESPAAVKPANAKMSVSWTARNSGVSPVAV